MNRKELSKLIPESPWDKLYEYKVRHRAENIREVGPYILFEIERHPGKGMSGIQLAGRSWTTLQTWRYNREEEKLMRTCEFDARCYCIEKNKLGAPICKNCGEKLDLYGDVFDKVWRCDNCGAIGGQEGAIFDPEIGEPLIEDQGEWERAGENVWLPKE